jgi:lysozyme
MTDEDRAALRESLKQHEGLRLRAYTDSTGHLTIGYGRNLSERGISLEEADAMLDRDIAEHERAVWARFPWVAALDGARQRVIVEMAFNLGLDGLAGFRTTLDAIRAGAFEDAAARMLQSRWADQVGQRARTLARLMREGVA